MVTPSGWYFNTVTESRAFATNRESRLLVEEQQCHQYLTLLSKTAKKACPFVRETF